MTSKRFFLVSLVFLTACTKEVEITPKTDFTQGIFIESILYPDESPRVFISRSLEFFKPEVTPQELFVRNASVQISSSLGVETLQPDSTFDKFRCRWVPFYEGITPTQFGQTYDLDISIDGKSYHASTTMNQKKPVIDTLEFVGEFFDIYGGHDGVVIYFKDEVGEGDFYRYQMNKFIDNEIRHVDVLEGIPPTCTQEGELYHVTDLGRSVFSDENSDGQDMRLFIEVAYQYRKGDSAWVFLQSLDPNAAKFYKELDDQLLARVNPFVEPVFLKSRIGDAIGVFGSAVRSDSVLFIFPVTAD